MSDALTSNEAWDLLDRLGAAYVLLAEVARDAAGPDVSLAELVALAVLAGAGPDGLSQADWGRYQGVSRQRAHVVAHQLTDKGLCAVTRRGRDAVARLTPEGRRATARLRARVGAAVQAALPEPVTGSARSLSSGLAELLEALGLPAPTSEGP